MTEHDTTPSGSGADSPGDLVAKYRSKLEEVAELVARIRHAERRNGKNNPSAETN